MPETQDLIEIQFTVVSQKYSGLRFEKAEDGSGLVSGQLHFSASYQGKSLEDKFAIELKIPANYPIQLPSVKETGGRIPQSFHHHDYGTLCLGAPLEIKMKFQKNPTLLEFVDDQVIPYLYSFSYFEYYGKLPYGELSHGGKGIIEYYRQLLKVESDMTILCFLRILTDDDYRGHLDCPCASGERMRNCHGIQLKKIMSYQRSNEFALEYIHVENYLSMMGNDIPKSHISKSLKRKPLARLMEKL